MSLFRRWLSIALCLGLFLGCEGRPRIWGGTGKRRGAAEPAAGSIGGGGLLAEFDLTEGVPESIGSGGIFPLPASRGYVGLVRTIERVRDDESLTGVLLRLGAIQLGWAQVEELGRLFAAVRKAKPVVCHAHVLDNATIWLAARACERIWLSPAGDVDTVGIAAEVVHIKGALDKLGVKADFLAMGKYKSAAEPVLLDEPSAATRESLGGVLASIRANWLAGVGASAPSPRSRWLVEHGPWSASEAQKEKLVHSVGFESDARKHALSQAAASEHQIVFGPGSGEPAGSEFAKVIRLLAGSDLGAGGRASIAVVPAIGGITMGSEGLLAAEGIGARSLQKTLRRLEKDESVRAVVLRIDSPGGSALASDLLWHEIRVLGARKPVVASIGDMAASGGYYLACAAHRVVAERTSIVGSIGVVGGKLVIADALERFGVRPFVVSASDEAGAESRAAYLSMLQEWDDDTRARVRAQMARVYDLFRERVAAGRKLAPERVLASAEGRIWTGEQGVSLGLVDELGGLIRAIEVARKLGDLDAAAPVIVEGLAESLLEALMLGDDAGAEEVEVALRSLKREQTAAGRLVPAQLLPFVQSLSPILGRERVVVALPFSMSVR